MSVLVDTNILVAATIGEPNRGERARELLDADLDFATTLFNLMEYRTVLTKKKHIEQDRVEELIDGLFDRIAVYGPETGDLIEAYAHQRESLLYPMDCVILATANEIGTDLVTFDRDLIQHGAVSPEQVLER